MSYITCILRMVFCIISKSYNFKTNAMMVKIDHFLAKISAWWPLVIKVTIKLITKNIISKNNIIHFLHQVTKYLLSSRKMRKVQTNYANSKFLAKIDQSSMYLNDVQTKYQKEKYYNQNHKTLFAYLFCIHICLTDRQTTYLENK